MNHQHLNDFIRISEEHKITLEFETPEVLKSALDEYRNSILNYEIQKRFKELTFTIVYELNLEKRKVVSCRAIVSSAYLHLTPYYSYVNSHLDVIRLLFDRYPILDIDAEFMIMWSGKETHVIENTEGFGYMIPSYVPIGTPPITITDEELLNFYEKAIISPTQKKFLIDQFDIVGPHYIEFHKNSTTPITYTFHAYIIEGIIEKHYYPWKNYKNMTSVFKLLNEEFLESLLLVQISTENENFFALQFSVSIDQSFSFIDKLSTFRCIDENIIEALNLMKIPDYLDTIMFKIYWENESTQNLKVYLETHNRDFIESTF